MFNWRLYRAASVPIVFVLAIVAFSLTPRPHPFTSSLAPDAFDGARAFAETSTLAAEFPTRRPGSRGDERLAAHIAQALEGLGGTAGGGFSVHTRRFQAQTIDGERTLTTVVAERPGSTAASPIVIFAHRDAAARGAPAEISGTAALLELARVFSARETRRTIVLVSTSGGSGGDAGATDFASSAHGPFDAAIVLGDLAGSTQRKPVVVPFSDGFGSAPVQLQRTVEDAITKQLGGDPGAPSTVGQLAHLAFPFATGEQGSLNALGLPAVLVQVSGERGPAANEPVSGEQMELFGRAVLSAVDALDAAPDVSREEQTGLAVQRQIIPAWALRLLVASLLLGPLVLAVDGLARLLRRGERVGRFTLWTLSCAAPFIACALFVYLLGWLSILRAAPADPVLATASTVGGSALSAVAASGLVLVLAWLTWPLLVRALGLSVRPTSDAAGLSMLLVLLAVALVVWVLNPFAALLLVPALHVLPWIASSELRPRPAGALTLMALAFLPFILLVAFYAHQLGLGLLEGAYTAMLLLAGGHIGLGAALLWSVALGCLFAGLILALIPPPALAGPGDGEDSRITIRGPSRYAGPGSLGGTESALRR